MALIRIRFLNGKTLGLTIGEVNAIERMARQNGTDPDQIQHGPGHVNWNTVSNLVHKGVMRREHGLNYFVEGLLAVHGPTLHSDEQFTMNPYRLQDRLIEEG
jgi:hypothetical protein